MERSETSVAFVIYGNSAPPHNLKAIFRQWHDEDWPFKSSKINSIDIDDAVDMLERERFRIKELQGECLPLGVDPDKLEVRLSFVSPDDNSII